MWELCRQTMVCFSSTTLGLTTSDPSKFSSAPASFHSVCLLAERLYQLVQDDFSTLPQIQRFEQKLRSNVEFEQFQFRNDLTFRTEIQIKR